MESGKKDKPCCACGWTNIRIPTYASSGSSKLKLRMCIAIMAGKRWEKRRLWNPTYRPWALLCIHNVYLPVFYFRITLRLRHTHVFTISWCNCLRSLLKLSPCTPLNKITVQSHSVFVPPTALTDQSNKYDWVHWVNYRLHYLIICTYNEGQLMHILLVIHTRHSYNTQPHPALNRMHEDMKPC
jgi:hypothetical protein